MAMSATIHAHISNPDPFVFMHFNVEFFFIRSMLPLLLSSIVFHKLKSKNHLLLLHYSFLQLKRVCVCVCFFNSSLFVEKYIDTSIFHSFSFIFVIV